MRGGRLSLLVVARGLLVRRAHERLPPRQSPRPPTLLQPREAQRDGAGALFEQGGRPILAAARFDHRPGLSMVGGDEMQDEIAPVVRQRLEFGVLLHGRARTRIRAGSRQASPGRSARASWREDLVSAVSSFVTRRLEGALPARRFLAFVMQAGARRARAFAATSERPTAFGDAHHLAPRPVLMRGQLLRLRDRARVLLLGGIPEMLDDEPLQRVAIAIATENEIVLEPPIVVLLSRFAFGRSNRRTRNRLPCSSRQMPSAVSEDRRRLRSSMPSFSPPKRASTTRILPTSSS